MGYLTFAAVITFLIAATLALVVYDDAKYGGFDKKVLRVAVLSMFTSPLAGFWLPVAMVVGVVYGIYRAFRVAFVD